MTETYTLTLQCDDRPGLVAAVATRLAATDANIVDAAQFNDRDAGRFFMRVAFEMLNDTPVDTLQREFGHLAVQTGMHWRIRRDAAPVKVLILVSKLDHCIGDLLYRRRIGELAMDVVGIVGNHPREALTISLSGGIPYHHLPITRDTKPQQEAQIRDIVTQTGAELVVLARYMQILSDEMATFLAAAASTSTIRSCPASRARSRIIRRMRVA